MNEIVSTRLQLYERKLQKQDMELKQLRAQLRPIRFYPHHIAHIHRKMTQKLTDILISVLVSHTLVNLESELEHINIYFEMR